MTSSRRQFIKKTALASSALALGPYFVFGQAQPATLMKRDMGRLGFEATTLGLGGQASLQWTPEGVDAVKIILKAFDLGVNYFDTANVYGPSQAYYGNAFRELNLIPGVPGYNERLRRSIFLTSKTFIRFGRGAAAKPAFAKAPAGKPDAAKVPAGKPDAAKVPAGKPDAAKVPSPKPPQLVTDDIRRSLSQIFGDGSGSYPQGAYLDMMLVHGIGMAGGMTDVDNVFEGYEKTDSKADNIGVLATLIDFRDGSNLTGLNPREERLIRHIGFSGHAGSDTMIEMIHRDTRGVLDGMLVTINANDRRYFSMQTNVIPVAAANNMGIIAMKVFADGAMYEKDAMFTSRADQVIRTVGSAEVPSRRLIEYVMTNPHIHTAVIGIGHIDDNQAACQLRQNIAAAQIAPNGLSETDRRDIEKLAGTIKNGNTNYFQAAASPLGAPRNPVVARQTGSTGNIARLTWQTAFAGDEPIARYEIMRDGLKVGEVAHRPQVTAAPFSFEDAISDQSKRNYRIVAVDAVGRTAQTDELLLESA